MKALKTTSRAWILILTVAMLTGMSANAWNARGHRLVAAIAYKKLSLEQKDEVKNLLMYHPEYGRRWKYLYENGDLDIELGMFLMMEASVWPDDVRDEDHPQAGHHRPTWHYVTYKLRFEGGTHDTGLPDPLKEPNIVMAIEHCMSRAQNLMLNLDERAIALAWAIHLIGDIHQPLHCASLFNSVYSKGDKGGNGFFVKQDATSANLHSLWDKSLGTGKSTREINKDATRLLGNHEATARKGGNAREWSLESFEHAKKDSHKSGNLKGTVKTNANNAPALPENYIDDMKKLAELRSVEAGLRLAVTLSTLPISEFYEHDEEDH